MQASQVLEKLLPAFERYYTVNKDSEPPFFAQAEFRSHNEQYFLVRSAHIADIDSNEFVYFAATQALTKEELEEFSKKAWAEGLTKVRPYNGHRNSDITLIILADTLAQDKNQLINQIKKTKFYKSYQFSLQGWSNFKLAVVELETQHIYFNRFGKDYKNLLEKNIFQNSLGGKIK